MGASGRLACFLGIVLSVWTLLHAYAFQRAFSIPGVARGVELVGAVWMGVLFLAFASLLTADVVTGFGRLWPKGAIPARAVAPAPARRGPRAPMGVWGVTGNHEDYAGLERCLAVSEAAGIRALRDEWVEVALGLVLAGVDDLTARRPLGIDGRTLDRAFSGVPKDAVVVLLSHSPLLVGEAASRGARLMLSGHTHGGQLWPFTFLSAIPYPFQAGRYEVEGMTLVVSRGTGTWGPPMRLFFRSEIVEVILRT